MIHYLKALLLYKAPRVTFYLNVFLEFVFFVFLMLLYIRFYTLYNTLYVYPDYNLYLMLPVLIFKNVLLFLFTCLPFSFIAFFIWLQQNVMFTMCIIYIIYNLSVNFVKTLFVVHPDLKPILKVIDFLICIIYIYNIFSAGGYPTRIF